MSNKVPNGITNLTSQDWSDILSSLDAIPRKKLINLIETKLKNKQCNSKKRSFNDLNDDTNENENEDKLREPPSKKPRKDENENKRSNDSSINMLCNQLTEQATKDGIKKIVVGGLILNDKNEMLVLQRAKNEFMPNIYEIASGTKETNDKTLIDCLSREVKEESGLILQKVLKSVGSF
eukprot:999729_1